MLFKFKGIAFVKNKILYKEKKGTVQEFHI
jgi:hypothetical protein